MSGLLKKEIRLLLPNWIAALLLVSLIRLLKSSPPTDDLVEVLLFWVSPLLMVMLAISSFGRELSVGTFPNLLAQPVTRSRIWWTKTLVLAGALFFIGVIWCSSALLADPRSHQNPADLHKALGQLALLPLVVYSGALWTVLLLRQVVAAFWLTVLIPAMLAMFTMYFTQELGVGAQMDSWIIVVLVIYSIVGFWAAMRMFLRAQDVQWTGGEIALPGWLKLPLWPASSRVMQGRHPRLALLRKEFLLHQSQLVIAGVLGVLHLAVVLLRPERSNLNSLPALEFVTYHLWLLWPVMALLIGCAAVAEERRLGTLEAQLCLPVRRRTQFVLKAGTALGLSLFFGVVMPVLFEGGRILPEIETPNLTQQTPLWAWSIISLLSPLAPFLPFVIVSAVLLGVSFYASTLARNTLQAIAPAILGIVMIGVLVFGAETISGSHNPPWRGPLIYLFGVPVLALTLAGFAYWNFKRVLVGWPVWRRNLITFLAALIGVMVVTTAVYHRAWELCLRLEPAHGSGRLSRTELSTVQIEGDGITGRLPDGRLWQSKWLYNVTPDEIGRPTLVKPQVLGGSNWMHLAYFQNESVAIQSDGSLWLLEMPRTAMAITNNRLVVGRSEPAQLTHIGNETNWQQVIRAAWWPAFLLLKTDGSLWIWGTNRFDHRQKWPGMAAFEIRRLGDDYAWGDMACVGYNIYIWKTNGQTWMADPSLRRPKKEAAIELAPGLTIERHPGLDHTRWRSLANSGPYQIQMGVRDDGTLRIMGRDVIEGRISSETNWAAVSCVHEAGGDMKVVALKTDGSLWRWDFSLGQSIGLTAAKPVRLSSHNDWVAITGDWTGLVSLAADGSLWHWQFEPRSLQLAGFTVPPLLAASRRPQRLGSIFDAVE
jgi:ABC-type transport system involved in multi-copper enzyme maturation permease subunit